MSDVPTESISLNAVLLLEQPATLKASSVPGNSRLMVRLDRVRDGVLVAEAITGVTRSLTVLGPAYDLQVIRYCDGHMCPAACTGWVQGHFCSPTLLQAMLG